VRTAVRTYAVNWECVAKFALFNVVPRPWAFVGAGLNPARLLSVIAWRWLAALLTALPEPALERSEGRQSTAIEGKKHPSNDQDLFCPKGFLVAQKTLLGMTTRAGKANCFT
jgi:hypothetical protein